MTWAEDKALRGRNLSADPGVANESGRLPMPPDSFPLICNINAKNPNVNTLSVSLIQRTVFHFRLNQNTVTRSSRDAARWSVSARLPANWDSRDSCVKALTIDQIVKRPACRAMSKAFVINALVNLASESNRWTSSAS